MDGADQTLKKLLRKHYCRTSPPPELKRNLLWKARLTRVQAMRKTLFGLKQHLGTVPGETETRSWQVSMHSYLERR
jgi:hypothetical protein